MNKKKSPTDNLIFPSGRSVKRCKSDAKDKRKQSKNTSEYLSLNKALNIIAMENGMDLTWDKAISKLLNDKTKAEQETLYRSMSGKLKNVESLFKKQAIDSFCNDGKFMLPDGEGGTVEAFQHNHQPNGLVVTQEVVNLIEEDIRKLGGIEMLKGEGGSGLQLFYERPGSTCHLAHEFHLDEQGTIFYYCRTLPWSGYEAEYHARGHEVQPSGLGSRPIDSALHLSGFAFIHSVLTPKALTT